jgi:glycosyltransferase involved in cell wall biosynthesis/ADP-heptose:LPS heptosyltransferase
MRIVIDMQGAQTSSRYRGIGRFTMALAEAIVRNKGGHEVILALNGAFEDSIEPIREAFRGLLPRESIRLWFAPGPVAGLDPANDRRREVAQVIREAFLASLFPDVILIPSLFEGFGDNAVSSVRVLDRTTRVAIVLHDLTPVHLERYRTDSIFRAAYDRKLDFLNKADLLLSVSDFSRRDAIDILSFDEQKIVTISEGCDPSFRQMELSPGDRERIFAQARISRPFMMYIGGADGSKNLHRLIQAYSRLPDTLRRQHQLVFVGYMPEGNVRELREVGQSFGLTESEFVFTGYVTDDEVIKLYNVCALFVFPSLYEGFGLPPLEAMACGAPVIASNAASLPEVVGYDEAMFDPRSVEAIRDKMVRGLTDEAFRRRLVDNGLVRARNFSWDASAKKALAALEKLPTSSDVLHDPVLQIEKVTVFESRKLRILLLKLDHIGDFLLALPAISKLKARYPDASVDIVVGSWNAELAKSLKLFDRVFTFDFYRKNSADRPRSTKKDLTTFLDSLDIYDIAIDLRRQRDTRFILARIPAKTRIGYQTFRPAIDSCLSIVLPAYLDEKFEATPLNQTSISRQMLALIDALPYDVSDYVCLPLLREKRGRLAGHIAIFPNAGNAAREWSAENFKALAEALTREEQVKKVTLYFASDRDAAAFSGVIGGKAEVRIGLGFDDLVDSLSEYAVCVANNSMGAHLASYLGLTVIAIYAGQETVEEWAPPFGNAFVINRGAECAPCHIAQRSDCTRGLFCLNDIRVGFVFDRVMEAVQGADRVRTTAAFGGSNDVVKQTVAAIAERTQGRLSDDEQIQIARCLAASIPSPGAKKQLFLDISELARTDAGSGIQRVVRSVLNHVLRNPPEDFEAVPVYFSPGDSQYLRAVRFAKRFLGLPVSPGDTDVPVDYHAGDVFFALDLNLADLEAYSVALTGMRRRGLTVKFLVYDLLAVLMPEYSDPPLSLVFQRWLEVVAESDGAVCISWAVADEFRAWMFKHAPQRLNDFEVDWFHLGADMAQSVPSAGLPPGAEPVLLKMQDDPAFLMVGTIEPRKGHAQVLDAFEGLWDSGRNVRLVIVGKAGWLVDELLERLHAHPELGKRLVWLEGISDEYLEKVYAASACLIAASWGEGFGLPLIEAAQHKLPILARDIPVFREVAGEHAHYFKAESGAELAEAIDEWLSLKESGQAPLSENMPFLTWKQSAENLIGLVVRRTSELI